MDVYRLNRYLVQLYCLIMVLAAPCFSQFSQLTDNPSRDWDPYYSPDGQWIAFTSDRTGTDQIYKMHAEGGDAIQVTSMITGAMHPCWSPDGQSIAFCSQDAGGQDIWTISPEGGTPIRITTHPSREESLGWSHGGDRIAYDTDRDGDWEIYVISLPSGVTSRLTNHSGFDTGPEGSPDGSKIAFSRTVEGSSNIWILDVRRNIDEPLFQLTTAPAFEGYPAWSPDGSLIAYGSDRSGNFDVWLIDADNPGSEPVQLTTDPGMDYYPSFSPDGTTLVFGSERSGNPDLWMLDLGSLTNVDRDDKKESLPDQFILLQSYPNPFNATTQLRYCLPVQTKVTVAIYNLKGQPVRVLINGKVLNRGEHTVTWNGKDQSGQHVESGTYFCRLTSDIATDTIKLLLLK